MDIAGASALVTGGASGLGLATARRLAAAGAAVTIIDLPTSAVLAIEGHHFAPVRRVRWRNDDLVFESVIRSPNGEDVLYVYHAADQGEYLLLPYNLIRKEIASPLQCHGYSLFADGTMAVFRAMEEPTRVHPLQIWRTPFNTVEHAAAAPRDGSYLAKVGNADLVRGISDALALRR